MKGSGGKGRRRSRKGKPWTWEDAFRVVCGEMGLAPSEFYRLQYCELVLLLDGYRARLKQEARRMRYESAWLAHIYLLPHTAKDADPITPAQLLGWKPRRKKAARHFATPVAALDAFFAAQSEQGIGVGAHGE